MSLPSVTEILAPYSDYSQVPAGRLEAAAERGSLVHRIIAAEIQDLWVPAVPEEAAGYLESFRRWWPVVEDVKAVEVELVSESLGFKGHPDLICRLKGDECLTIVDWKTPAATQRIWRAQLAGYWWLAKDQFGLCRRAALRLKRDGGRAILDPFEDQEDIGAFVSALNFHKYLRRIK